MKYEVVGTPQIQSEYTTDEFQTVMVIDLKREDGETGDVWIIAGVPDSDQGTCKAAGTQSGYQDAWVFGDSAESWCPESFLVPDAEDEDDPWTWSATHKTYKGVRDDVIEACRAVAIKAHRQRLSEDEIVGNCTGCGDPVKRSDATWHTGSCYCPGCELAPEEAE